MFTSIGADNFVSEIITESRPVLMAYIVPDYACTGQLEVLEISSKRYFDDSIKICLTNENFVESRAIMDLGIDGSPTFILFYRGKEKARIIGKADTETLVSFVIKNLAKF